LSFAWWNIVQNGRYERIRGENSRMLFWYSQVYLQYRREAQDYIDTLVVYINDVGGSSRIGEITKYNVVGVLLGNQFNSA
jgi:hypothetical protein